MRTRFIIVLMAALAAIFTTGCRIGVEGDRTPKQSNVVTKPKPKSEIKTSDGAVEVDMDPSDDTEPEQETDNDSKTQEKIDYEQALRESYDSQIGVREKTGNNDGKDVEKYLRSTGLPKGNPWCAAFVHWNLEQAGIPNTINASSPTAYSKKRVSFKGGKWMREFRPGQVFTLYYKNLGRIGHTGFVDDLDGTMAITVEGNTNVAGSREGDGVYKKRRPLNGLYAICDWYPR